MGAVGHVPLRDGVEICGCSGTCTLSSKGELCDMLHQENLYDLR